MSNSPRIIDGAAVAETVLAECRAQIETLKTQGHTPGLAVVLVGDNPASRSYVRAKDRMCQKIGMHSVKLELPAETTQAELLDVVARLNADPARSTASSCNRRRPNTSTRPAVVLAIDPAKDVDGFHPVNVGKLAVGDPSGFVPCTPLGCQRLLIEAGVETAGARVVMLGRSLLVGKPFALLMMGKGKGGDATVTVAHSRSRDLREILRGADILVVAIGKAGFVTGEDVREGAVVIDVGINQVPAPELPRGYRLVGDVDFASVAPRCAAITPVPGGVGPMTIAMLMSNTIKACRLSVLADACPPMATHGGPDSDGGMRKRAIGFGWQSQQPRSGSICERRAAAVDFAIAPGGSRSARVELAEVGGSMWYDAPSCRRTTSQPTPTPRSTRSLPACCAWAIPAWPSTDRSLSCRRSPPPTTVGGKPGARGGRERSP